MSEERTFSIKKQTIKSMCNAVRKRGKTTDLLSIPNGYIDAVNAIDTGGTDLVTQDDFIVFYDYDGTILDSCNRERAKTVNYPLTPDHEGLTIAEWNYSLEEIHNTKSPLDVAAIYKINDGRIHLKVFMFKECVYTVTVVNERDANDEWVEELKPVIVNWGDGTGDHEIRYHDPEYPGYWPYRKDFHQYTESKEYDISIQGYDGMEFDNGFISMYSSRSIYDNHVLTYGQSIEEFVTELWLPKYKINQTYKYEDRKFYFPSVEKIIFDADTVDAPCELWNGLENDYMRENTGSLRFVGFPSKMKTFPVLQNQTRLFAASIPNVKVIQHDPFANHPKLQRICYPPNLENTPGGFAMPYRGFNSLKIVYFGENLKTFDIDVSSLGDVDVDISAVKQVPKMTNPPAGPLDNLLSHKIIKIFIPKALEQQFKNDPDWGKIKDNLFAI